jgi:hypothetical protein
VSSSVFLRVAADDESQPGIIKIFQELWGTEDLIASFDGMNASLPINEKTGRTDLKITKAWPRTSSPSAYSMADKRYRPKPTSNRPIRIISRYRKSRPERSGRWWSMRLEGISSNASSSFRCYWWI